MMELTLPDGSVRSVSAGTSALDVARSIGPGLARAAVGAELDRRLIDLRAPIEASGPFRLITVRDEEAGVFLRHTAEHVLADAVQRLWPGTQIDVGRRDHSEKYQYDFRFPRAFVPEDLETIEAKMREILAEKHEIERTEISRRQARELFGDLGEELKLERLEDIPEGEPITLFRHGEFVDLCRGPHAQRVDQVGAVKLLESSGVFYRGDERRERLQRIYGTAFATRDALKGYLADLELRRARDHRRLGPELDLFSFTPHAPGSPFFHPRGTVIYNLLVDYVQGLNRRDGFEEVRTPQILDVDLWRRSGHWDNYRQSMFFTEVDERQYAVKPMNCPTHCLIYRTGLRSYRDLPIRYADFGRLHRYERSGVITGLTRVRTFCQDDAHTFCTEEQVEAEVLRPVSTILEIYRTFGFDDIRIEVSTRPEKSIGSAELWQRAEAALKGALGSRDLEFEVNEGDGAFYGPKIDFQARDTLGRSWQLGTVQLDYQMPERLDLEYTASDGGTRRPVMLHRAMLGSVERFLGILIEHTGGAFPVWLAPTQAVLLPVSDRFLDYGAEVEKRLAATGVRVELDRRSEKLGYKIRDAQRLQGPLHAGHRRPRTGGRHRVAAAPRGSRRQRRTRSGAGDDRLPGRAHRRPDRLQVARSVTQDST